MGDIDRVCLMQDTPTIERLREAISLVQDKDALLKERQKVDERIETVNNSIAGILAQDILNRAQSHRRGEVSDKIMQVLRDAGRSGLRIGEVAKRIKMPKKNVQAWFTQTGRNRPIERIAPGLYRVRR